MLVDDGPEPSWVVVGSGSAGYRHAAALRRRDRSATITVVRRPESHQPRARLDALDVRYVPTVDAALDAAPTVAVVAGPAPRHEAAVAALLGAGADVLVEKPLAATAAAGAAIDAAARQSPRSVCVGYHLRGDELTAAFRSAVQGIGEVEAFDLHVGQHLDLWRPGVDPARSVSARQELGGGVLLELSHELDAASWCFGTIAAVAARTRTDGAPTDGRVETVADVEVTSATGALGTVHLDMVSRSPRRTWRAVGATGTVEADLLAGTIRGTGTAARSSRDVAPGGRDRAEARLIDNLFEVHTGAASAMCTVAEALQVLHVIDAIRASAAGGGTRTTVAAPVGAPGGGAR
ncbi:Gfo/Idh/MocA family protein [Aquihabitans sp. McL0605]|uniref:Gfo/Idh/MocA family protein n=1 Tax=Aquihabitans sp. McL0605 TaxID=3415671 RepID=UPI003CEDF0DC